MQIRGPFLTPVREKSGQSSRLSEGIIRSRDHHCRSRLGSHTQTKDRANRLNHRCIRFLGWQPASHLGQLRGWPAAVTCHANGNFPIARGRKLDKKGISTPLRSTINLPTPLSKSSSASQTIESPCTRTLAGELGGVRSSTPSLAKYWS